MIAPVPKARVVRETVLIVGEGYAEEAFLKHLRHLYTSKADGRSLTVRNARGKGAVSVVATTARIARQIPHMHVGTLFDSDTDPDGRASADATRRKIKPIACDPCLEAVLLRIYGDSTQRDSSGHKKAFQQRFSCEAHDPGVYSKYFPREVLDAGRDHSPQLHALLIMLDC